MLFGPQEMCRWARDAVELLYAACATIEQAGAPDWSRTNNSDNPQLRPIRNVGERSSNEAGKERLWNCLECYRYTTAECSAGRI